VIEQSNAWQITSALLAYAYISQNAQRMDDTLRTASPDP